MRHYCLICGIYDHKKYIRAHIIKKHRKKFWDDFLSPKKPKELIIVKKKQEKPKDNFDKLWSQECCKQTFFDMRSFLSHNDLCQTITRKEAINNWVNNRRKVLGWTGEKIPIILINTGGLIG